MRGEAILVLSRMARATLVWLIRRQLLPLSADEAKAITTTTWSAVPRPAGCFS